MQYTKYTLSNGVRVVLVPIKTMTTATILVSVGTGSRYETMQEHGLSHFVEHMFFKGTKKRPTSMAISKEFEAIGAYQNAYTGKDRTAFHAKVPARNILAAIDLVGDLFCNATLVQREITKEAGTIVQEISMYEDTPAHKIYDIFESVVFGAEHPLGRSIAGTKESVRALKRKDFLSYLARCYSARNTVVCVVGNFPQGKVRTKIRADFGQLAPIDKPACEAFIDRQDAPVLRWEHKKTDQTHVLVGVKTGGFDHKDRYVYAVLAQILGGGMSSRIWEQVRDKRGLAYAVRAVTDYFVEAGYLGIYAGVAHKNLQPTIALILAEMKKVARRGVTQEEFTRARSGFEGRLAFSLETSDEIASSYGDQESVRGAIITPEESLRRIKKVTRADVARAAREIFVDRGLNGAIIGPRTAQTESSIKSIFHF